MEPPPFTPLKQFDVQSINLNEVPGDGYDFLKHVIVERLHCPETVVTDKDFSQYDTNQTIWCDQFLEKFPHSDNDRRLVPSEIWQQGASLSQQDKNILHRFISTPPLISIVIRLTERSVYRALEYLITEFIDSGYEYERAHWMFALMCCIGVPLQHSTCAALRELARSCRKLRRTCECADCEIARACSVFICLSARYFGQLDLADSLVS
ncbi:unnamed protein product [Soboliphyme baturini]|uniref:Gem-associated protein 2 n=1 Tax=Soboliphyme baturini TaxID=241478 RepID=A0A183J902_9BILA|nr:unnamed protein product [Soboliphyme baturini]